jgi:hypothetical protein
VREGLCWGSLKDGIEMNSSEIDKCGLGYGQVASCYHGSEPLCPVKCRELLDGMRDC